MATPILVRCWTSQCLALPPRIPGLFSWSLKTGQEHLLDVSVAPGPYKQLSRAAVFADDGQEAVGVHYPHNFPSMFLLMYAANSRFANWCLRGGGIATIDSL
jgi:hypothetical protein